MVVASDIMLLCIVVTNRFAFVFDNGSAEARQFQFFLERTIRRVRLVDLFVLVLVRIIFQTEQCVQSGDQLLEELRDL